MRGVRLGRILLIAALVEVIGLLANAVTTLVTNAANGPLRWLAPPAVALAAALGKAVVDAVGKDRPAGVAGPERPAPGTPPGPTTASGPPPGYGRPGTYRSGTPYPGGRVSGSARVPYPAAVPGRRRGTSVLIAVLVLVLACGGGGFAVSAGARYAVGWVSGKESGPDRLAQPASGRSGNLTLTVGRVLDTAHFTRVELTVRNEGESSVYLPLSGNCVFTRDDGTVLEADGFRSQWSDTVPPGALQKGMVTFSGRLPRSAFRASLSFSLVYRPGGGALTVRGIEVLPG